jgi:hypothetical protein
MSDEGSVPTDGLGTLLTEMHTWLKEKLRG